MRARLTAVAAVLAATGLMTSACATQSGSATNHAPFLPLPAALPVSEEDWI